MALDDFDPILKTEAADDVPNKLLKAAPKFTEWINMRKWKDFSLMNWLESDAGILREDLLKFENLTG